MNTQTNELNPYLKACKLLGVTPIRELKERGNKDVVAADAFYRLTICIRAKNMLKGKEWQPVYDGTELHYYPVWAKNKSGFGFSYSFYVNWHSGTYVGSRLEYRTRELVKEGVVEFKQYYDDML